MCPSSTSSSERASGSPDRDGARGGSPFRFLARAGLFLLPLLLLAAPAQWIIWSTGEAMPLSLAAREQSRDPRMLYGRGVLSQQFEALKIMMLRRTRPQILVLGDSRTMQLRDFMFAPLARHFYNAGGAAVGVGDLDAFAEAMEQGRLPRPKLLMVGLSHWWFRRDGGEQGRYLRDPGSFHDAAYNLKAQEAASLALYRSWWRKGAYPLPPVNPLVQGWERAVVGLGARRGRAFRQDGSRMSLHHVEEFQESGVYRDRENPPVYQRVQQGLFPFRRGMRFDPRKARQAAEALARLRALGVEVWAWLPPFSDQTHRAAAQRPGLTKYLRAYREDLAGLLRARGVPVVSVSHPSRIGLDDRCMFDGMHPGEVFCARIVEQMAAQAPPDSLLAGLDRRALAALPASAAVPPLVLRLP